MNPRLALNQLFLERFFARSWHGWYPQQRFLRVVSIEVLRNFLNEFKSLTIQYTLAIEDRGVETTIIVHGQARSRRHEDYRAPLLAYRGTTYLYAHGFSSLIYRPLGYIAAANLFLYKDLPGTPLLEVFDHKLSHLSATTIRAAWRHRAPEIANFLRQLHSSKRPPGIPAHPRVALDDLLAGFRQLTTSIFPHTSRRAFQLLSECEATYPQLARRLHSADRRRFTHGDFHLGHAINHGRRLKFIDFGDCAWQDPAFDLGRLIAQTSHQFPTLESVRAVRDRVVASYYRRHPSAEDTFAVNYFCLVNVLQMMSMEPPREEHKHPRVARGYTQQLRVYADGILASRQGHQSV